MQVENENFVRSFTKDPNNKKKATTMAFDPVTHSRLKAMSLQNNLSMAEVIRRLAAADAQTVDRLLNGPELSNSQDGKTIYKRIMGMVRR